MILIVAVQIGVETDGHVIPGGEAIGYILLGIFTLEVGHRRVTRRASLFLVESLDYILGQYGHGSFYKVHSVTTYTPHTYFATDHHQTYRRWKVEVVLVRQLEPFRLFHRR